MKLLLTGGLGYIGSHTAIELLNKGYDVVIVDNLSNTTRDVAGKIAKAAGRAAVFVNADICNENAMNKVLTAHKVDAVIHFAGYKSVGESVKKPVEYYKNNIGGTVSLLNAMTRHNVNKIVFSSSATVYGDQKVLPFREDFTLSATSPYGETKIVIEHMLRDLCTANPHFSATALRYFNPVGAHESGLVGENPIGVPNNLVPFIARVADGSLPHLNIFGNDYPTVDGTGVRDYIHINDLVLGHIAALEHMTGGFNVYNLGTGHGTSVLQLITAYERAVGKKIPYQFVPRREGDIAEMYADCSKAKRELGWTAKLSIDDMCHSTISYTNKKKGEIK
jgi:UDP-glucose 4-epimerase